MHMNQKSLLRFFGSSADGVPPLRNAPTPQTATVTATLTDAQMLGEILYVDQGAGATTTLTTPTGTQLSASFGGPVNVGDSFDLFVINRETDAGGNMVLAMGTDVTLIGNNDVEEEDAVANSSSAHFRFRNTGANIWDCMRLA